MCEKFKQSNSYHVFVANVRNQSDSSNRYNPCFNNRLPGTLLRSLVILDFEQELHGKSNAILLFVIERLHTKILVHDNCLCDVPKETFDLGIFNLVGLDLLVIFTL